MCDRCAELEEEVAYLKSELGLISDASFLARIMHAFSVPPAPARLVEILYRANGRIIDKGRLSDLLGTISEARVIDVYLCRLRKRMGREAFAAPWGQGVGLSAIGRKMVDAAQPRLAA